jgi:hypothetical protein
MPKTGIKQFALLNLFDQGKAWNFTAMERHIYVDKSGKTAWFDELLNTQKYVEVLVSWSK